MERDLAATTALVLSGGGVRGAYEVGVLKGIADVLGLKQDSASLFKIFAGTSVGALNAAYMVGNAHHGDFNIDGLADIWKNLSVETHLRLGLKARPKLLSAKWYQGPFIDARPLELLIRRSVDWSVLHENIASGVARALVVSAFNLASSQTTIFAETTPGVEYKPSPDPSRHAHKERLTPDHILASAAIPLIFPSRRLGHAFYCDGSVRFNTPISPAVRCGAERLVVVTVRRESSAQSVKEKLDRHPTPLFVVGKLLNAVFLDPFEYDLSVMARFNELFSILQETLTAEEMERVDQVVTKMRGAPYRKLSTLIFSPSEDIGKLAGEHLRANLEGLKLPRIPKWFLRRAAVAESTWEADWAAYVLFDGSFAAKLIDLGYRDAFARAEEIKRFFPGHETQPA